MFELDTTPQPSMRIWSRGIKLGLASFRRLFALASVLGFISLLPAIYLAWKMGDNPITPDTMLRVLRQGHFALNFLLLELLVLVLSSLINALIIQRLDHAAQGTAMVHELQFALRKTATLVLAGILFFITLLIGIFIADIIGTLLGALLGTMLGHGATVVVIRVCLIVAIMFIIVNLLFFQFAIVLDGKGPVSALNHSCALVFHNWWHSFLVLLMIVAAIVGIVVVVMLPFMHWLPLLAAADTGRALMEKSVLRLVGVAIFTPFVVGVLYVLYHDLKTRRAQKSTATGAVQA